jgi:hypothetical protein
VPVNHAPDIFCASGVAASPFVSDLLLSSWRPAQCGVVNPKCTLWCAAALLAGDVALVAPIDSAILVTTLWNSNVSATGVD